MNDESPVPASSIDPESFKGKVYLLLIDKIVIGLFIGLVLAGYNQLRIQESRHYERQEKEEARSYKRADYLRALLPMIDDSETDVVVRAELLAALTDTDSIDDAVAFALTERLLMDGLVRAKNQVPEHLRWDGQHFLITSLVRRVGRKVDDDAAHFLDPLFRQYDYHLLSQSEQDESQPHAERRILDDTTDFWKSLFVQLVKSMSDDQLRVLDRDEEFRSNIHRIWGLSEHSPVNFQDEWSKRPIRALRLVAALNELQRFPDTEAEAPKFKAAAKLDPDEKFVADEACSEEDSTRSAGVLDLMAENGIATEELIRSCLLIALQWTKHPISSTAGEQSFAAMQYIQSIAKSGWLGTVSKYSAQPIKEFSAMVGATPLTKLNFQEVVPAERGLVEALIDGVDAHGSGNFDDAETTARQILRELYELPPDKLNAARLADIRPPWISQEH